MDKPLSQERLSEEDVNVIEYVLIQQKVEISYDSQLLMFAELKRLQAIETQQNLQTKYIGFLKSVIRSGETLGKYEDIEEFAKSIKGADPNE